MVAALALMATLLVATLLLKGRLVHRQASAERQLRAAAAADALLTHWWADPRTFPVVAAGDVANDSTLGWATHLVPNPPVDALEARVVRLEIVDRSRRESPVVLGVDVVLPLPGVPRE